MQQFYTVNRWKRVINLTFPLLQPKKNRRAFARLFELLSSPGLREAIPQYYGVMVVR